MSKVTKKRKERMRTRKWRQGPSQYYDPELIFLVRGVLSKIHVCLTKMVADERARASPRITCCPTAPAYSSALTETHYPEKP